MAVSGSAVGQLQYDCATPRQRINSPANGGCDDYRKAPSISSKAYNASNRSDSIKNNAGDPLIFEKEDSNDSEDNPAIKGPSVAIQTRAVFSKRHFTKSSSPTLQLQKYLLANGDAISRSSELSVNLTVCLDFITIRLSGNHDREIHQKQLQQQQQQLRWASEGGWKLCHQLKHYKQVNPRQRSMGMLSDPQILCFVDRPFDVSQLPAGIPAEMSNMKQELFRLKTFSLLGRPSFQELCKTGQTPEDLAADGFFYMQEADRVKCTFCLGVLFNWKADEDVRASHRLKFSTCPFLLGMDVANVPIPRPGDKDEKVKVSEACSDDAGVPAGVDWSLRTAGHHPEPELECCYHLACRPLPPVSATAAAAACRLGAADNLDMLARSLQSRDAAARYHPMRHPAWRDCATRENSLARTSSSLAVPPDLLAAAGFFLDAELRTSCYWCGLRVLNWQVADDPWVEHARWSPRCCHLLLERGHQFVLSSRASSPPFQPAQPTRQSPAGPLLSAACDSSEGSSPTPLAFVSGSNPLIDYRIEPRYFKAREDFPPALAVLQVGCDPEDAKTAQFLQLKGTGDDFPSYEIFLSCVLRQNRRRQELGISGRELYERAQQEQLASCVREPKPLGDDDVDWRACKVCMDKVINVTLLDCKHLCCCSNCARHLDNCPLCRAPIRATMLVNMD